MSDQTVLVVWHILRATARVLASLADVAIWWALIWAMLTDRALLIRPFDRQLFSFPARRPASQETPT